MNSFTLCLALLLLACVQAIVSESISRIGIIGGGIGGTSCAFFLRTLFGLKGINIDLFEAEKIGGRLSTVNFAKKKYEEGGSIIHYRNKYMSYFLDKCKLFKKERTNRHLALFDGKNFVFSESKWFIKTLWTLWNRYGFGMWKLKNHVEAMLHSFDRIYELQNAGKTYDTVEELLQAIDSKFPGYLNISVELGYKKLGISDIVIKEIIMATTLANYGQNLSVHQMAGSVSMAGGMGNVWSVYGGNLMIPHCLLTASKANLILQPVASVKKLPSNQLKISIESGTYLNETYDAVVLAAPQTYEAKHRIQFIGFDNEINFFGRYHKTVCTLIKGSLSKNYFPKKNSYIDEILGVKDNLLFNSIGKITPVDYACNDTDEKDVWKIFSQKPLKQKELFSLFSQVKDMYVREWLAYPHYESLDAKKQNSFILAPNLYFVNAIEWAASAMEMSIIGAKNVALLLRNNLSGSNSSPFHDTSNNAQQNVEL